MTTIIRIKYADNNSLMEESRDTASRISSGTSTINKEFLVNINCNIGLITDYIKESIDLQSAEFDLWEESTGELKNLSSWKPWISGMEVFQSNDTYFCVIMERNQEKRTSKLGITWTFPGSSNGQLTNYVPRIGGKVPKALSDLITKMKKLNKKKSLTTETLVRDNAGRKRLSGNEK